MMRVHNDLSSGFDRSNELVVICPETRAAALTTLPPN